MSGKAFQNLYGNAGKDELTKPLQDYAGSPWGFQVSGRAITDGTELTPRPVMVFLVL
ncbi:hypothetical protein OIU34_32280 [Pararhizobium sp. BT-229]|uniref:hypothetical protein n=1 Tax=Pararhizobium sp. BT-229 TaxID=2986923 RepID=UPI0021F69D40|nr:hypothetical protein [Pararhizobium sp. BT-229]MCV9966555.1 hypothetical protein [Pararhizobium sp. BT-229]